MKFKLFLLIGLIIVINPINLISQHLDSQDVIVSISHHVNIDTVIAYREGEKVEYLNDKHFRKEQIKTPELALQAFACFSSVEWGQHLAGQGYKEVNFPSEKVVKLRRSEDYIKNFSVKIYFTMYFEQNGRQLAGCFSKTYINPNAQEVFQMVFFEQVQEGWKLYNDEWTTSLTYLSKFKPQYATELVLGQTRKDDIILNELIKKAVINKMLDLGIVQLIIEQDLEKYSKYLN